MPFTLAQLKSEIQTDPTARGYAAQGGNDEAKATLINAVQGGIAIDRGVIPAYEIVDATAAAEWAALSAAEKQRYQTLTGAGQVNSASVNTRAAFQAMFGAGTATRTALTALLTRTGSRGEQLWGLGTTITAQDIGRALAS